MREGQAEAEMEEAKAEDRAIRRLHDCDDGTCGNKWCWKCADEGGEKMCPIMIDADLLIKTLEEQKKSKFKTADDLEDSPTKDYIKGLGSGVGVALQIVKFMADEQKEKRA